MACSTAPEGHDHWTLRLLAGKVVELGFSVLSRCCLKQRVPHEPALRREVQALVTERNITRSTIDWQFNTQDARTKLHSLYPFDS